MGTIKCVICETEQPATIEFFHRRVGSKYGLRADCKRCRKERKLVGNRVRPTRKCTKCNKEFPNNSDYFYIRNNKIRQRTRSICKGCHSIYFKSHHLKSKYNLTIEEFNNMLSKQDNKCIICSSTPKEFVVDHDHSTGLVRGILCDTCNTGLGMFKDNQNFLNNAIKYLKDHHDKNTNVK